MSDDDGAGSARSGDSQMFAIFGFAVLLLFVLPITIWRISSGLGAEVAVVQPWQKSQAQKSSLARRLRGYCNRFNIILAVMWLVIVGLGLFISTIKVEAEAFNPFTILEISETATEKEIKKAYRKMSQKFHPDKTDDPAHHKFFAEKVTKAHQALTDETSRENYIKYGHPDGPQAMNIGVALPEWVFANDKRTAPLVLLALVFVGLAVPILMIAFYLHRAEGKVGANKVMEQTLVMYHRFSVKEMLRVTKMHEAIVPANEFMNIHLTPAQKSAFKTFSQTVMRMYDVTRMPKWWTPEILRTYLFLIAYLDRNTALVPEELKKDLHETLRLVPIMCEEFVKACVAPRNRFRRGWFMPAEAAVQFQQCVVQQVRPEVLAPPADERKKRKVSGEAAAALLQLPGVNEEIIKELEKPYKIKSLTDLAGKPDTERAEALSKAGVGEAEVAQVHDMLLSLPHVHITKVKAFVEEEADIKEADVLTVQAWIAITRASHAELGGKLNMRQRRAGVQAFTPRFPHPINEKWYVFLTNQRVETPSTWAHSMTDMSDAEAAGVANYGTLGCQWATKPKAPSAADTSDSAASTATGTGNAAAASAATAATATSGAATSGAGGVNGDAAEPEPIGQKVEFKFMLQEPGKFNLTLVVMPSCWLGCNATAPVPFTVLRQTAAEKAGKGPARGAAAKAAATFLDGDEVEDDEEEDEDEESDDGEGWDSDETGTDISHEEEPQEDPSASTGTTTDTKKDA